MATLAKLVEATGHRLVVGVEASPEARPGLPDTPLGRRLRRRRLTDILAAIEAIGIHLTRGGLSDGLVYDAVRAPSSRSAKRSRGPGCGARCRTASGCGRAHRRLRSRGTASRH